VNVIQNLFCKQSVVFGITLLLIGINSLALLSNASGKVHHLSSAVITDEKNFPKDIKVPDCVEIGDLLLFDLNRDESNRWKRPGPHNEHGALYIGNNTFVDANPKSVHARNYSFYYYTWRQKNLAFLRIKTANDSQRQAAVQWAISKIGTHYQNFFLSLGLKIARTNLPFPSAKKMYCMEFLWAAYYLQGIDLDRNGWKFPVWVTGNDIIYDDDIEVIYEELNDSTEFIKPYKGVYVGNKKIISLFDGMNSSFVFGCIDIYVVTYNKMITSVNFYIDNVFKETDTIPPYFMRWDDHDCGKKVIKAVACDNTGNQYFANITVWKFF
jgi:uncharacterized protein YycO